MSATGETVGLAGWIIDDITCLVYIYNLVTVSYIVRILVQVFMMDLQIKNILFSVQVLVFLFWTFLSRRVAGVFIIVRIEFDCFFVLSPIRRKRQKILRNKAENGLSSDENFRS